MPVRDPRVDAYIAQSADFARPILEHIRQIVHEVCPDVEETIKWNAPHFQYRGMLCAMAAFKEHCVLRFWKGALVVDGDDGAGEFRQLTTVTQLPSKKVLAGYVKKAMTLNDLGVKSPERPKANAPREIVVPDDLTRALQGNATARATFEGLSPSHQREYIEWLTEAKTEATRNRRLATTLEWLAEGKSRNWKYQRR